MPENRAKAWFDPQELARAAANTKGDLSAKGDFGCYATANATGKLDGSGVESHNLVHAAERVRLYRSLWRGRSASAIADMGCGLGLTTGALAEQFPQAAVIGYDVSEDAVEYGKKHFPRAEFETSVIAEDTQLGRVFDIILCQEFYPFTRTADWDLHSKMLATFKRHLSKDGVIVVELSLRDAATSIIVNLGKINGFRIAKTLMPYDRIFRMVPNVMLSRIISFFLSLVVKTPRNVHFVLTPLKEI